MQTLNRKDVISKGVFSAAFSKIIGFAYQIFTVPILLLILGEENFGILSIALVLIGWINMINGGLSPHLTKILTENRPKKEISLIINISRTIILYAIGIYLYK